ncbi:cation efflux family protein [Podospora appendiculata]|uniref:Cation efflux family protein n=1 Tax=Podospora appendiculata TaxID=314037 RepID=A0AAE0XA85_9PEZI|nr:cation efflux family protein [Podospora appendiculata]
MALKMGTKQRLIATIVISFAFFISEITVAFKTKSLALMADSFHYMNDLIGFIVALSAIIISERSHSPQHLSFGWQRARTLGAFFNGVFLLALGISIFLQSIERFIYLTPVENPKLVLIMGCVGLTLNIISAIFLHEHGGHDHGHSHGDGHEHGHDHEHGHSHNNHNQADRIECLEVPALTRDTDSAVEDCSITSHPHAEHRHVLRAITRHGRDLGMLGALIHVIGDALNNLGVIIAAIVIWFVSSPNRFYADPGVSMGISIMILLSALPLVKNSGYILLQSAPLGVELDDVKHDIEKIPGIESIHELHIWRLDQKKAVATAHLVVSDQSVANFMEKARTVRECLHAYGIHSATLQPELLPTQPQMPAAPESAISAAAAAAASSAEGGGVGSGTEMRSRAGGDVSSKTTTSGSSATGASSLSRRKGAGAAACQLICGKGLCENVMCCRTAQLG